ncbi:aspartyl protease family protein 2-like [Papaver somniferum]|uniref:aspartyl protease family protein 2-like n=1 Tax=Papaver somniferum TaxID=3469 RepID=UPI000E7048B6|nr:aspartyl protease family protein 2-like [Papaver somniferum]
MDLIKHQHLSDKLMGSNSNNGGNIDEGFEFPVTPGKYWNTSMISAFLYEYYVVLRISISPSNPYLLHMDTGSSLTWIQCLPCDKCFEQVAPMYNPIRSLTYSVKYCSEYKSLCSGCNERGECTYSRVYGDETYSHGVIAGEVCRLDQSDSVFLMNLTFGCAHNSSEKYKGMDGFLGLGRGELSFASQLDSRYGFKKFSYCLVDKSTTKILPESSLRFGEDVLDQPTDVVYTPMIQNPKLSSQYFINLTSISVADNHIPTHMSLPNGIMVDSGSTDTWLPKPIYEAVRDSFHAAALQLGWKQDVSEYPANLCYDMSIFTDGISIINTPAVTLYFDGDDDAFVELQPQNLLRNYPRIGVNIHCLAVQASIWDGIAILGNTQQQGIRVVYDNVASVIGFDPNSC